MTCSLKFNPNPCMREERGNELISPLEDSGKGIVDVGPEMT
jgi:hypothetical protein